MEVLIQVPTEPIQEQHEDQQYQLHLQEIQQEDLRLQRPEEAQAQSINNLVAVIIQGVLIDHQEVLATHAVAAQDLDQVVLCQDHQEEVEVQEEEEDHQAVEEEDANPYY